MTLVQITASFDTLDTLRATPLPGEEFPYATTGYCGVKCCSKCGATKTPQWREGPCGPKTLCNACGVKRTRTLRALQEGSKRRRPSPAALRAQADPSGAGCDSPDVSSAGLSAPPPLFVGTGFGPAAPRRPQRRAAEEAAVRTARYARTGEWGEAGAGAAPAAPASPTSSQDTALGPCGEGVEELAWTPLAAEAAARHGLGAAAIDSACYAAVNLMTLAAKERAGGEAAWAGRPAPARGGDGGDTQNTQRPGTPVPTGAGSTSGAPLPLGAASPLPVQRPARPSAGTLGGGGLPALPALTGVDLPALYKSLPPSQVVELIGLNAELEGALAAARDAGASVAALAQLLAEKQAAGLAARQAARAASRRMHRFLDSLRC
uniref:GATA-type domain-containing protein n=1 Tax=Auxenochlorella protothecoides TaxID=3075 RepID=A0A1D2A4N0_AUXPR